MFGSLPHDLKFIIGCCEQRTQQMGQLVYVTFREDEAAVANQLRYLNHSPKPNAEFEGAELYAIRAIKPGEEITFDYGREFVG